ncbi:MAG TPA: ammonium transporter [Chthonomonadales bacterium]|nr:ammonium transporter [Chthonomonadales bacterium]
MDRTSHSTPAFRRGALVAVFTTVLLGAAGAALAQGGEAAPRIDTGDTAWLLMSTAMVLLMTPGLALFYAGMVRSRNVLSMLMQSFVAMGVATVIWVVVGYSLAFSPGSPFVGGLSWVGLSGVGMEPNADYGATVPHQAFMLFQMMFAIITPALISGAIAERMKFGAYVLFIAVWSVAVYAPLAHMVWGVGGFLRELGALDFAGGTVVHISSGVSALVLALIVGKRRTDASEDLRPHNLPLTLIGTGMLWFGWFGFNGGSAIASNGLAASAFMVTHIAASAAALAWVLIEWCVYKKPTALGFATGAVAGLVAITPASGFVGPVAALAIGGGVSVISFCAIRAKSRLGYDDTLDVFAVHGCGGAWGALATGLFATTAINSVGANGLFAGGGMALLAKQAIGVVVAAGYAGVVTAIIAYALKASTGLRVPGDAEVAGLDLAEHGEAGYAGATAGVELGQAPQPAAAVHASAPAGAA